MSKSLLALASFVVGALLMVAANTAAIDQVNIPNVGPVWVWTPEEMDKLETVLQSLIGERAALKRRVKTLEAQCV